MIDNLLSTMMELNIAAGVIIPLVLWLRRPLQQRFGAGAAYLLWALVPLAMLAVLVPARTVVSVAPSPLPVERVALPAPYTEPLASPLAATNLPAVTVPTSPAVNAPQGVSDPAPASPTLSPVLDAHSEQLGAPQVGTGSILMLPAGLWALLIWAAGTGFYASLLMRRQRRYEAAIAPLRPRMMKGVQVWQAPHAETGPALVGVLSPRIVIPADFEQRYADEEQRLILAHEMVHRRRGDPLANGVLAIITCLCWFNPLVHIGATRFRIDQELSCDAAVLTDHPGHRRDYGQALLKEMLTGPALPLGCHWQPHHPLKERLTMLKQMTPNRATRLSGSVCVGALLAGVSTLAWASQPATVTNVAASANAAASVSQGAAPTRLAQYATGPVLVSDQFDVNQVEITNARAIVRILPEARSDYALTIQGNYTPQIDATRRTLKIEGPLPKNNWNCKRNSPAAIANDDDGMVITLRTPMDADVTAGGVIYGEVGQVKNGDLAFMGCGTATLAGATGALDLSLHGSVDADMGDVKGPLDLSLHGSTGLKMGAVGGPLDASLHGSTKLTAGDVAGGADVSVHGSNRTKIGRIAGPLDANLHGSVRLTVASVEGETDASMHGSTRLDIGQQQASLDASLHGSSSIDIDQINARDVEVSANGGSELNLGDGKIDRLEIDLRGGADARFEGYAVNAVVDNNTSNDIYIGRVDKLTQDDDHGRRRGTVITKNGSDR